jgi:hypothetical protein
MEVKPSLLYDYMGEEGRSETEEVLMLLASDYIEKDKDDRYFLDCVRNIKRDELENKKDQLTAQANSETDVEKRRQLLRAIIETNARLQNL